MFVQKICLLKFVKFTPIWKLPVSRETMLNALQINSFQTIFSIKNIWKLCHWLIGYLLRDACCVWTVLMRGWWCREVVHSEAPHSRFIRLNVDDENSEETGADPESTDPVCTSISRLCSPAVFVPFVLNAVYISEKVSW